MLPATDHIDFEEPDSVCVALLQNPRQYIVHPNCFHVINACRQSNTARVVELADEKRVPPNSSEIAYHKCTVQSRQPADLAPAHSLHNAQYRMSKWFTVLRACLCWQDWPRVSHSDTGNSGRSGRAPFGCANRSSARHNHSIKSVALLTARMTRRGYLNGRCQPGSVDAHWLETDHAVTHLRYAIQ